LLFLNELKRKPSEVERLSGELLDELDGYARHRRNQL
jgi:hypothetical protein